MSPHLAAPIPTGTTPTTNNKREAILLGTAEHAHTQHYDDMMHERLYKVLQGSLRLHPTNAADLVQHDVYDPEPPSSSPSTNESDAPQKKCIVLTDDRLAPDFRATKQDLLASTQPKAVYKYRRR